MRRRVRAASTGAAGRARWWVAPGGRGHDGLGHRLGEGRRRGRHRRGRVVGDAVAVGVSVGTGGTVVVGFGFGDVPEMIEDREGQRRSSRPVAVAHSAPRWNCSSEYVVEPTEEELLVAGPGRRRSPSVGLVADGQAGIGPQLADGFGPHRQAQKPSGPTPATGSRDPGEWPRRWRCRRRRTGSNMAFAGDVHAVMAEELS
jgi:hypothetical protein